MMAVNSSITWSARMNGTHGFLAEGLRIVTIQEHAMPKTLGITVPKRIMVIIPGRLFRNGIESVLRSTGGFIVNGCETLDEAEDVLKRYPETQPDLFVIGMDVPASAAADLTRIRALRAKMPEGRWIVLSNSCGGPDFWWQAVESRVDGVLHEDSPGEVLQLLVRLILLGYSFLPASASMALGASLAAPDGPEIPTVARDQSMHEMFQVQQRPSVEMSQSTPRMRAGLSDRESEILRGLVAGQSNKGIARDLNISEATVKVHVKALLRKMQVTNRTQAAISAVRFLDHPAPENAPASAGKIDQSSGRP